MERVDSFTQNKSSLLAKLKSAQNYGMSSEPVDVEVDISFGVPGVTIVGLATKAVDEAKDRVKAAIKNSGAEYPNKRITVNLAPANIPKEGPSFDLPIAIALLFASGQLEDGRIKKSLIFGELSLDGKLRRVSGAVSHAILAKEQNFEYLIIPKENLKEVDIIPGVKVLAFESLEELILSFRGMRDLEVYETKGWKERKDFHESNLDFSLVKGQETAKRALEIAAAGGHNLLFSGPPGSGKTLLAKTFPTILPPLTTDEMIEITKVYSISGLLSETNPYIGKRPFRSPHHTISYAAMVGGGRIPRPGEISLAHRGVLFLDELPEFPRQVLEAMRQPLEDRVVTVSRVQGSLTYPASFTMVSAMNPCPCGFATDPEKNCTCSPSSIIRYKKKISGPILDRIDMFVEVPRVKYEKLKSIQSGEKSEKIRERVLKAREAQNLRFENSRVVSNSEMGVRELKEFVSLDESGEKLMKQAVTSMKLSARSYHKILRLSRTIADLSGKGNIEMSHVAEALQYRSKL